MSDEEDWFERALRELDEESDRDGDEEDGGEGDADERDRDGERDADEGDTARNKDEEPTSGVEDGLDLDDGTTGDDETTGDDGGIGRGGAPSGGDPAPESDAETADEADPEAEEDPFGGGSGGDGDRDATADRDPFGGGGDESDEGSFGDDDPFGGGGGSGGGSFGEGDPFGSGSGGGGGGESFGAGDPFGSGGGSFGEGDPFGGGGESGAADGPIGFDEADAEEFESDIDRTDVGIDGLDEMILGGVPSRSLLTVIGGAGTGKTTFSLQFLNEALESDERGVYITLEQSRESIVATAEEKGWPFREYVEEGQLAVVSLDPIEMANSLASIRNDLTRLIAEFGADRLVLDSVSLLEMMYDHPAKRRSEVFGFTRLLKEAGVTTLLTSEASEETPYASRYGLVEYLTDGVFVLQYVRGSDFRETRLAVEIQKIRDANHSRETKPYEITDSGISVYRQANIF
ncbi:KaiC domain-containing protein [Halorubrum aethiopicum]|uniref:KaiC domain-containing protein n=1 Tax=Halorubrum aethiopicum TaxID=1758255 RepID=UPI000833A0B2|nr:KaiC domain-containing protein [Halorubrum aethiopicum]